MKAMNVADKLVSTARVSIFLAIIALPLNAQAEYYLVYGPPAVACDYCHTPRVYHRPVHKVCKVQKVCKVHKVKTYKKRCYHATPRKRSHYSTTVYYPVPVYTRPSCGSCDGFLQPTYYWAPAPNRVYYQHPDDRLVGNRYEESYYNSNPSLDTGTADNDIY